MYDIGICARKQGQAALASTHGEFHAHAQIRGLSSRGLSSFSQSRFRLGGPGDLALIQAQTHRVRCHTQAEWRRRHARTEASTRNRLRQSYSVWNGTPPPSPSVWKHIGGFGKKKPPPVFCARNREAVSDTPAQALARVSSGSKHPGVSPGSSYLSLPNSFPARVSPKSLPLQVSPKSLPAQVSPSLSRLKSPQSLSRLKSPQVSPSLSRLKSPQSLSRLKSPQVSPGPSLPKVSSSSSLPKSLPAQVSPKSLPAQVSPGDRRQPSPGEGGGIGEVW
jgi:hypothetical protein